MTGEIEQVRKLREVNINELFCRWEIHFRWVLRDSRRVGITTIATIEKVSWITVGEYYFITLKAF